METRLAWVLNFDAEMELAAPDGPGAPARLRSKMRGLVGQLSGLVKPGDVLVDGAAGVVARAGAVPARGLSGRAWCPTPRALAVLIAAGARPPDAPSLAVLQQANHRGLQQRVDASGCGGQLVGSVQEALAVIDSPAPFGWWLAKQPFGFAGRGQRRLAGRPREADLAWLHKGFRSGHGLWLEHGLNIEQEFSLHGVLGPTGELAVGRPVRQCCDRSGRWLSSEPGGGNLSPAEQRALGAGLEEVAAHLSAIGYHGPFGIDACRHRSPQGQRRFRAVMEVNARFSMGFALSGLAP